ncbi:MAG: sugar transferase [Actinobacteria bacterium]|nr:MAG: sugar transferase [Actinomycetota bacterium]
MSERREPAGRRKKVQLTVKWLVDRTVAAAGLVALAPLFAVVAVAIKLDSPGPVFFRQERVGKDGRPFRVWKFRTMLPESARPEAGYFVDKEDPGITKTGRVLRRWSLDELPQLLNVLAGQMSLVGPRPTLAYQVQQYNDFQRQRLLMRPGLTGHAQVTGRNALPWTKRIELDVEYIRNWSLLLDLKLLFKTPLAVLSKEGIYAEGGVSDFKPPGQD